MERQRHHHLQRRHAHPDAGSGLGGNRVAGSGCVPRASDIPPCASGRPALPFLVEQHRRSRSWHLCRVARLTRSASRPGHRLTCVVRAGPSAFCTPGGLVRTAVRPYPPRGFRRRAPGSRRHRCRRGKSLYVRVFRVGDRDRDVLERTLDTDHAADMVRS